MPIRHLVVSLIVACAAAVLIFAVGSAIRDGGVGVREGDTSMAHEPAGAAADIGLERAESAGVVAEDGHRSKKSTDSPGAAEHRATPITISTVYDVVFGNDDGSPLSQIHSQFKNEQRDNSWADATESGIRLSIAKSGANDWATVEHIECRATICEIAGFMPDRMQHPELDPRELFPDDFGIGWWQGQIDMALRTHTYDDEGITRFLIIVANTRVFVQRAPRDD
ncbi:MAG: hypothetical protein ACREDZ_10745 [Kiloniellales bacterium]